MPRLTVTVLGASALTTLGTLPVYVFTSQAVIIRDELSLGPGRLGLAVSVYFVAAATSALLGGRLIDSVGRRASTIAAGVTVAIGSLAVALTAPAYDVLVAAMLVLGLANAACQLTSNLLMARTVPPHRRGFGFAVKQAAIPVSIALGGLSVPTVTALAGWRAPFLIIGVAGCAAAVVGARLQRSSTGGGERARSADRPPTPALVLVLAATCLASGAANALAAFGAVWAHQAGLTPGQAGVLIAVGSAANVLMRLVAGHLADRRHGRNLPVVAAQMAVGALALAVLSATSASTVVVAELVAFGIGWSWPGLLIFAVVRVSRDAPSRASGFVQAGAYVGGATGPLAFGLLAGNLGYPTAWRVAALAFLLAAALILLARQRFIVDLVRRPPETPIGYGGGRHAPARVAGRTAG